MRLNSIKLSGFKSFADMTQFHLPGQLVGVVGPNGCGKSNIMDAVRWVLGESKASELRGESMQDVIFNGSGHRRPAGRASVELAFSNDQGRAGGAWNRYADIAVKRVLTRDGTSSYHINGQPVRRRDVQDVFLGTGLGPRAYAIIGQGTISRIIESRPEELRLFLEEAAGVSKYKERRRETEARLRDARDNLTRVDDILRELKTQLDKLERQAAVANQYRRLQELATRRLHQSWFLRQTAAADEQRGIEARVTSATTELEARLAELRHGEAELDAVRAAHYAAGDALHIGQGVLAEAALEVSRLEERRRHQHETRQRLQQRAADVRAEGRNWAERLASAEEESVRTRERHVAAVVDAEAASALARTLAQQMPGHESALQAAQHATRLRRTEVVAVQQQLQVLATETRHIDDERRQIDFRREKLVTEQRQLVRPDPAALAVVQTDATQAEELRSTADARLAEASERTVPLDRERRAAQEQAQAERARAGAAAAKLEALRALQARVQTEEKLLPWLKRHGLDGLPPLWQRISVEPGWETAVESVLRERIGALELSRLDTVDAFEGDARPPSKLAFHVTDVSTPMPAVAAAELPGFPLLATKLRAANGHGSALQPLLAGWMAHARTAASLGDALAARDRLGPCDVLVTPQGHTVGAATVAFYAEDSAQAGLLARARDIEHLQRETRALELQADGSRSVLVRAEAACTRHAEDLVALRQQATQAQTTAHRLKVEALQQTQVAERTAAQFERLTVDLTDLAERDAKLREAAAAAEARFAVLDRQLAELQEAHAGAEDELIGAERRLAEARERQRQHDKLAQEVQFDVRTLAARLAELDRNIATAQTQLQTVQADIAQLDAEAASHDDAAVDDALQTALARRARSEAELATQRAAYDDLAGRLRRADEQRMQRERGVQPLRDAIGRLQLDAQAARLGSVQFSAQLAEVGADPQVLASSIAEEGLELNGILADIERLQRQIDAIGAVNLAALDELGAATERKGFLDAQNADLLEAIHTLEGAIHKIDLETRDLLGTTFSLVNEHFGRLFPTLFGGGEARLVMTGGEILDAGVQVMAQPPGKKNSSIHLLSGGEKALTAIALVFAIFQLNPAPFCLLDEVDAPLDDANTERYAKLVRSMSTSTQFLFISHNRIAMEMAGQLVGVTMQEQGVSRIVAVDVAAAISLAQAA